MAETGSGDGAQAATTTTDQQGQAPAGDTPQGQAPTDGAPQETQHTDDPETFPREYVQELRRSEAATRTRLAALEAAEQERARAAMSETERARAEATEAAAERDRLRGELDEYRRGTHITTALGDALNPATTRRLLDLSGVEWNDDGTPKGKGLEAAVAKLKASDPYLFKRAAPNGGGAAGAGGGTRAPGGGVQTNAAVNALIRSRGSRAARL